MLLCFSGSVNFCPVGDLYRLLRNVRSHNHVLIFADYLVRLPFFYHLTLVQQKDPAVEDAKRCPKVIV